MFAAIASVLQLIVDPCYALTGNWWVAIFLFTLITKVILIPMSLWVQWNSIVMVRVMPKLNAIKVKYFGDRETIGEKQNELYKEQHYHPLLSLVPLLVQILILFGLVDVIHSITDSGTPGTEFLGMVPVEDGGLSWLMPVLAGLSAVALGFAQNRINPLQREQSRAEKNMTNGLSIGLSFILGVFVAAGMAFYWICSNLIAILIQVLMNICIRPKKYIDYPELRQSQEELEELNSLESERKRKWYVHDPLTAREKADYKRFFNIMGKHIVFFSEGSGFYKYFKGTIQWLLANSNIIIHYVTNDPDDRIFAIAAEQPRIRPYYIGVKRSITLMMKMDADVVVTTLEDLDNFYIKRSYLRDDIMYAFMFHHMTSVILTATPHAYDHYDALLCVGPHQELELRLQEEVYGLKPKELVKAGYDLIDEEIASYQGLIAQKGSNERPTILIAPSWQEDNLLDLCFDGLMEGLLGHGWKVIVRPHPEYTKRYRSRWEAIMARYGQVPEEELFFEKDFSSNETIWTSDVLITDWSSISCEFSFSTCKPCIFLDTPMKVGNPEWERFGLEPTDITLRNEIGISFPPEDAVQIGTAVETMLSQAQDWHDRIAEVRDGFIYNLGHGAEASGEFLLNAVLEKQAERKTDAA